MQIHVTPIYAVLTALLFLVLSVAVILHRRTKKIAYGSGDDLDVEARIRSQANWAEYAPIVLLLVLLAELQGIGPLWLHLTGLTLLIGRTLHGYAMGFNRKFFQGRVIGTALTLTSLIFGILINAVAIIF